MPRIPTTNSGPPAAEIPATTSGPTPWRRRWRARAPDFAASSAKLQEPPAKKTAGASGRCRTWSAKSPWRLVAASGAATASFHSVSTWWRSAGVHRSISWQPVPGAVARARRTSRR